MTHDVKSLAAEIEGERTRLITWLAEYQVSTGSTIDREMTADTLMADFIAPRLAEIAALQSRAFEDGARWMPTGEGTLAVGGGGTREWFRASDGALQSYPMGFDPNVGAYTGLAIRALPLQPEGERSDA